MSMHETTALNNQLVLENAKSNHDYRLISGKFSNNEICLKGTC